MKKILDIIRRIRLRFMNANDYAKTIGVKMGKGCYISTKEFPSEGYLVEIGDYVRIANHVSLYTHGAIYPLRFLYKDDTLDHFGKIKIGSYTHIGSYAMIMPGVTIGSRCIVGAGAVVTKSVPDGCMVAGNPARIIGHTDDFYKRLKSKYDFGCKGMSFEEKKAFLLQQPEERFVRKRFMEDKID